MVERVFVVERIIWNEYNWNQKNLLYLGRSVVDVKYPEEKKPIRGESQIDGIYQEILLYLNNNFDLKITKGKFLVEKMSPVKSGYFITEIFIYPKYINLFFLIYCLW